MEARQPPSLFESKKAGDFCNGGADRHADAVIITATEAFSAAQQALAALAYMDTLNSTKVQLAFPDSAGCMKGGFTQMTLKDLYFRHMKCAPSEVAKDRTPVAVRISFRWALASISLRRSKIPASCIICSKLLHLCWKRSR